MTGDAVSPRARERLASPSFRLRASAWMLSPLLLLGLGTGLSFFYVGTRAKRPLWAVYGVAYLIGALLTIATPLLVLVWLGGAVHAWKVNSEWLRFRAREDEGAMTVPGVPVQGWNGPPPAASGHPDLEGLGVGPQAFYRASSPQQPPVPPPAAAAPPQPQPPPPPAVLVPVDINTADQEQIAQLPGMTPARASSVVAARRAHGPILSLVELGEIAGLQPHERLRLQDRVSFSDATPADGAGRDGRLLDI